MESVCYIERNHNHILKAYSPHLQTSKSIRVGPIAFFFFQYYTIDV